MKPWKRGSKHYVGKTRTDHKCENCREIIPKGSAAEYVNLFTGKRGYCHCRCPKEAIDKIVAENREACRIANMNLH